jgi:putative intracellular protease/amidase
MGTIGILLFDGLEELDAVGPWEVLAAWTQQWPDDGWSVTTVAQDGGLVRCAKGLVLQAEHSWADAPPLDVLIQPGGMGTRRQLVDETYLGWIRARRADTPLLASVCTGSLVYAAAGLLKAARRRRTGPRSTGWASSTRASRSARTTGTSTTAT